jgi:hypothetical protein
MHFWPIVDASRSLSALMVGLVEQTEAHVLVGLLFFLFLLLLFLLLFGRSGRTTSSGAASSSTSGTTRWN